jgi:type IV pilus assembly protein PilF
MKGALMKESRMRSKGNKVLAVLGLVFCLGASACSSAPSKGNRITSQQERAMLMIEAASAAQGEGDSTGALQHLVDAEKINPSLPELHHVRALALYSKKQLPAAIESARKAVVLKPDYSDAHNTLGKLLMENAQYSDAAIYLKKAASDLLYRDAYKALTNLGILYYRRGDDEKSEDYLRRAIESNSVRACVAHYYLGHVQLKQERFSEATRSYDKATQRFCASFAEAHYAMGVALEKGRQFDRARRKFLDVTRNFPAAEVAEKAKDRLRELP